MDNTIEKILERISAKRSFTNSLLTLQENNSIEIIEDTKWSILLSLKNNDLSRLGIKIGLELKGDDIKRKLSSGNIIGSAKLSSETGSLSVLIEPKVPVYRLVSIIEFLENDSYFSDEESETYSGNSDILTLQINRCLKLIANSLSSGSIRGYRNFSKELPYIKGRADFCQLISDNWRYGDLSVKCDFSDLTIDTLRNRVYRLALVKSSRVLSERKQTTLFNRARMMLYSLYSVQDKEFKRSEIEDLARKNPRDAAALLACRDVICNLSVSAHPGQARNFFSYSINMATLFQDYCHKLMSLALASRKLKPKKSPIFPIEGLKRGIHLDGLYGEGGSKVLLECKYKEISCIDQVNSADIYQAIAYSSHIDVNPQLSIMLFPAAQPGKAIEILGLISSFGISGKKIHVLTVDMSSSPQDVIKSLNELFADLL